MRASTWRELLLNLLIFSAVVVLFGGYLVNQAMSHSPTESFKTAHVRVENTNQILDGTGVFVSGVRVGQVTSVNVDPDGAVVDLEYNKNIEIPADSKITIGLQSALGEPYLNIHMGKFDGPMLPNGGTFTSDKVVEPDSIPGIFEQIQNLSSAVSAKPVAGLMKTLTEAFDGNEEALDSIAANTKLVGSMLLGKSDELKTMFANTQIYTASLGWIVEGLPQFSRGLQSILLEFIGTLDATQDLVVRGQLNNVMRNAVHPFLAELNPYVEELLPNVMDAAGPLMPIVSALNQTIPQVDISKFLAQLLELVGGGDGMTLVLNTQN